MGAPCWQHSFTCKRRGVLPFDVVTKLLVVLPFHLNLFWPSLHLTVPAPLFFSKCFRTDDDLADDSSIAKTGFFSISGCFAHALVAWIVRIMKRSSNIDGQILLFEYSIYSFHPQWGCHPKSFSIFCPSHSSQGWSADKVLLLLLFLFLFVCFIFI